MDCVYDTSEKQIITQVHISCVHMYISICSSHSMVKSLTKAARNLVKIFGSHLASKLFITQFVNFKPKDLSICLHTTATK